MPDIGKAYVQIVPTAQGISGSISNLLGGEAESAGEKAGGLFGNKFIAVAGKLIAAAGLGKIIGDALSEGGNLQQSYLGGLDTLYGEAADQAREFAKAAAESGISMNDYSEQAVSFGAALKSAFEGDTVKAAEAANTAILDMADNSAKMGTDITAVQTAYQGFAKQNYTMLDNLKLGYGGTKTEMERLLADATKLSGVEYNIDNLGDVYEAIHVIQEDLGLTGVAAAEASETLSGSAAAMKAAWSNLLGEMALGEDITDSLNTLLQTATTWLFSNFIPMVGNVLMTLPGAIANAISTGLPLLVEQGVAMLDNITTGIDQNLPSIIDGAISMLNSLIDTITANLPTIINAGLTLVGSLVTGLINNLPKLLQSGVQLIMSLLSGLVSAMPSILAKAGEIVQNIITAFKNINWSQLGIDIINGIVNGLKAVGGQIANYLLELGKQALDSIKAFFGIKSPSKVMAKEVGKWIPLGIVEGIQDNIKPLTNEMHDIADMTTASAVINANARTSTAIASGVNENEALLGRMDAMLSLMAQYYPDMAKDTVIDGNSLVNGIDRALGLKVV